MAIDFSGLGGLGGAVSTLFGAAGDAAEASAYGQAAKLASQNAQIAQESTAIQETQAQRQIFKVIGGQQAEVGGAGMLQSGSAQDLLRASASQGSLQKQLIQQQGAITAAGYQEEAAAYKGMQGAAKAASSGGIFGGLLQGAGAIASMFALSDEDLKEDIRFQRLDPSGVGIYRFRYKGDPQLYEGVLAQEVQRKRPDASIVHEGGVLGVNYEVLGVQLIPVKE